MRARSSSSAAPISADGSSASTCARSASSAAAVPIAPRNDAFNAAISFGSPIAGPILTITEFGSAVAFWSKRAVRSRVQHGSGPENASV
jgi:hypothetical protein